MHGVQPGSISQVQVFPVSPQDDTSHIKFIVLSSQTYHHLASLTRVKASHRAQLPRQSPGGTPDATPPLASSIPSTPSELVPALPRLVPLPHAQSHCLHATCPLCTCSAFLKNIMYMFLTCPLSLPLPSLSLLHRVIRMVLRANVTIISLLTVPRLSVYIV